MAQTELNDDGLIIPSQDLSNISPSVDDHDRMFHHDGSGTITLIDGSTTSAPGYYAWDNTNGSWNPLKNAARNATSLTTEGSTAAVKDTTNNRDLARFKESGIAEFPRTIQVGQTVPSGETYLVESGNGMVVAGPFTVDGTLEVNGSFTDTVGPLGGTGTVTGSGTITVTQ